MRRRQHDKPNPNPARLAHFRPEEWGGDEHASCRWYQARRDWQTAHPEDDLPLPDNAPDTAFHPEML